MAKCHMEADGDPTEDPNTKLDDVKKNEKPIKNNTKNSHKKKSSKVAYNKTQANKGVSNENGKDETDDVSMPKMDVAKEELVASEKSVQEDTVETELALPALVTPKYDHLPPSTEPGKKCYDTALLMRIKDYPLSKEKPNIALLESCNLIRTAPIQEPVTFNLIPRPVINDLLPNYAKSASILKSNIQRDFNDVRKLPHRNDARVMPQRNDVRNMPQRNDGRSMSQRNDVRNMPQRNDVRSISQRIDVSSIPQSGKSSGAVPFISISLARDEVKLNQVEDAWKPARFKMESLPDEELKTQDLYKKFRGILNKLTPQKFDTLVEKVKGLEINTQARLEGVIDLVFQKAIDEPNFSETYAAMCSKLSTIKVPSDNDPDQCVNFRVLIITRCQRQFETATVDERVLKLEDELAECADPVKKKELQEQLSEENRRVRMRSVGNVRFIGELYKLKMLTSRIMVYCLTTLIDKLEEEKLECLCKLLTTIGEQVERDAKHQLDSIFKKMQDIVQWQSGSISSRIRFMMQDVMDLRRGRWVSKSVVDSKPKTMVQIQKEAEQQQRNIELMNASPVGAGRAGDDTRRRSGDVRRDGYSPAADHQRRATAANYTVDTTKLRAAMNKISNIKLAPSSAWNHGSVGKKPVQANNSNVIGLSKNMFSVLEDVTSDPTGLTNSRSDSIELARSKSASKTTSRSGSIESLRTNSANNTISRSGSIELTRPNSTDKTTSRSGSFGSPRSISANKSTGRSGSIEMSRPDSANKITEQSSIEAPQLSSARKSTSRSGSAEASRSNSVSRSSSPSGSIQTPQSSPSQSANRSASTEAPRSNSVNRSTCPTIPIKASQTSPTKSTDRSALIEARRSKSARKNITRSGSIEVLRSDVANKSSSYSNLNETRQLNFPGKSTSRSGSVETTRPDSGINCPESIEESRSNFADKSSEQSASMEISRPDSGANSSGSIEESQSNSVDKSSDQSASIEASNSSGKIEAPWPNLRSSPVPQDLVLEDSKLQELRLLVAEMLINPNDEEFVSDFKRTYSAKYHSAAVAEMLNIALEKSPKDVHVIAKAMHHLVSTNTVCSEDFLTGIQETLQCAPDLYIDIPMLYEHLAKFIAPQIEKEYITFTQTFGLCGNIISSNQGHLFLKAVIKGLLKNIDPPTIERKWRESGLELRQWMGEEQVSKFINSNGLEFIDFGYGIKTVHFGGMYSASETQNIILLGLMKYDNDDFELIKYWMQYNFERESRESWFFEALLEALCEYALFNVGGPSFSRQSLKKCAPLLYAFGGDTREERQASCLAGIRQLLENLQNPPGMESEIYSYLRNRGFIPSASVSKWKSSGSVTETSDGDAVSI